MSRKKILRGILCLLFGDNNVTCSRRGKIIIKHGHAFKPFFFVSVSFYFVRNKLPDNDKPDIISPKKKTDVYVNYLIACINAIYFIVKEIGFGSIGALIVALVQNMQRPIKKTVVHSTTCVIWATPQQRVVGYTSRVLPVPLP